MIRVLIADDHKMFVDGIASILQAEKNIEVIGSSYDGPSIFKILEEKEVDVLLLDVNLPGMNGIEIAAKLAKTHPHIRILALSMYNEESFVTEILKKGAKGYILKNTGRNELITAISAVFNGQTYFSKDVTETIMAGMLRAKKVVKKATRSIIVPKLSRREREILSLIVKEHTNHEIAEELHITLKTVEYHRGSLLSKLNARNTAGLVRAALQHNLIKGM